MATTDLMTALRVASARFLPSWGDEVAQQRGGQIRVKQRRPDLWTASFSVEDMPFNEYRDVQGLIADLSGSRSTFLAWDPGRQYPKADPAGTLIVSPGAVQINSLNGDSVRMSLKGLPAGYTLSRGDMLSFAYGSSVALHEIRSPATTVASGGGVTAEFKVSPAIRPGASINAVVTLYRARAEMMIVPGSVSAREFSVWATLSFDAIQVLN